MKTLYLLRHAQTIGRQAGQRDYDRQLLPQGEASARRLAKNLVNLSSPIDFILSSSARRTRQTVYLVNQALQIPADKILFDSVLYDASEEQYRDRFKILPEGAASVLVVGHNPSLSVLACTFSGRMVDLAPCELIAFEFNISSWQNVPVIGKEAIRIAKQN